MTENNEKRASVLRRVSMLGIVANFILLVIKMLIGFAAHSQAMIADSLNSAGDIFASFMSYIGAKISSKPNDEDHPHGHGKAEYVFTQLISISMIVAAFVMINQSIESIILKRNIEFSLWLIVVCAITIITKFILYSYTKFKRKQYDSVLIQASMEDHRNDIFVTSGTLIGIIFSYFGFYYIDGIVGAAISIWIGYTGLQLFRSAYKVLMDTNIDEIKQKEVERIVLQEKEVLHVDSIISKPIGDKHLIILKVSMNGEKTIHESHAIAGKIKKDLVTQLNYVYDVIIHINPH